MSFRSRPALPEARQKSSFRSTVGQIISALRLEGFCRATPNSVDQGLLIAHGEKRGRYYVASPLVAEIGRSSQPVTKRIPNPYEQLSLDLEHP